MENLKKEETKNYNETSQINKTTKETQSEIKEQNPEIKSNENKKDQKEIAADTSKEDLHKEKLNSFNIEEIDTLYDQQVEFTKEEKDLRNKYLVKHSDKDILLRSIYLSKGKIFWRVFSHFFSILFDIVTFKLSTCNAESINAITEKDNNKLITNIYKFVFFTIVKRLMHDVQVGLRRHFFRRTGKSKNIILENFMREKDIEFFDVFKTGELFNKAQDYMSYPPYSAIEELIDLAQNIGTILYTGYYLFNKFFTMSIIAFCFYFFEAFITPLVKKNRNESKYSGNMEIRNDVLNEMLSNIRLIKSFATEDKELNKYYAIRKATSMGIYRGTIFGIICDIVRRSNEIAMLYLCGKSTINGTMQYGDLLMFNKYRDEFSTKFDVIKNQYNNLKCGIAEWRSFLEIYDIPCKIHNCENPIIPTQVNNNSNNKESKDKEEKDKESNNKEEKDKEEKDKEEKDKEEKDKETQNKEQLGLKVEFNNIKFSYPTKKDAVIFDNLSFKIEPGKVIAFVGRSGIGKSTITYLLQRFYDPDEGQIKINNIDIKQIDLNWLRRNIGIVSQEPILNSGNIKENILYGVDKYSESQFNYVCKLSLVDSFVQNKKLFPSGYSTLVGERGVKVSGGQKQRIAIARALMKNSQILIFDEATSALDAVSEASVQETINNIVKEKHTTTILIAHRLSTIKDADCIYVLDKGKIVECGTHQELIDKNGIYKKLFERQLVTSKG